MKTSKVPRKVSRVRLIGACLALVIAGCQQAGPQAGTTPKAETVLQEGQKVPLPEDSLPVNIRSAIQQDYGNDARYLDASSDLNGDSNPEILVYVLGMMSCGSGGCNLLVFTPEGTGYRRVSTISVTNPPIHAAKTSTQGWRNLIVHVAGGGAKPRDVELEFNGKAYPSNPTVTGAGVRQAPVVDAELLIREVSSFEEAKPLR